MNLHKDREKFKTVILMAEQDMRIDAGIIEKDYFVTLFLKILSNKTPEIIFKGGTSLSKCYKLIKRFSEDIDLNFESASRKVTEGMRKKMNTSIKATIAESHLRLLNADNIWGNQQYNKYILEYPAQFELGVLKPQLLVETATYIRAYPTEIKEATCYIYDYLCLAARKDIIDEYNLQPFNVKVQSLERTFIDKIFALGDYYLKGKVKEHSRHIYDLYKLLPLIQVSKELEELLEKVRNERAQNPNCLSAQNNVDMQIILGDIIKRNFYKNDYVNITYKLLYEEVPYEEAIKALKRIYEMGILDKMVKNQEKIAEQWYVFYHRQTNGNPYSRQGCAEKIEILADGRIPQVEMTSCGLNHGLLVGKGSYNAGIACCLLSKDGAAAYEAKRQISGIHPYFTQEGEDRESNPGQYIANFCSWTDSEESEFYRYKQEIISEVFSKTCLKSGFERSEIFMYL